MKELKLYIFRSLFIACTILMMASCNEKKHFNGYLYPIRENGLYGYIDSVGNRIIEPEFLWVSTFHDGVAIAVVDTVYKVFPDSMAYEVGIRDTIIDRYRMYAKYGYINKLGDFVIAPMFVSYVDMPEIGFVTSNMDNCSNALFRHAFFNNRAMFCDTTTWRNGYINLNGEIVIPPKYYYSDPFSNGLAIVRDLVAEPLYTNKVCISRLKLRSAYIDTLGNAITNFKYESLTKFRSGRGIGYYKKVNKEDVRIEDTTVVFESYTEPHFLIDSRGKEIKELNANYDYNSYGIDGVSVASENSSWRAFLGKESISYHFIDKDGNVLQPLKNLSDFQLDSLDKCDDIMQVLPESAEILKATFFNDGFAGITPDGEHWFVIDKYLLIHGYGEESIFEKFNGFCNGLAAVKKNGKWGYINKHIKEQIPFKYDSCGIAYPFLEEVFEYDIQGNVKKKAYINREDCLVWECSDYNSEKAQNRYSIKNSKDYGKWTYEYSSSNKYFIYLIVGVIIVLLITISVVWKSVYHKPSKGDNLEGLVVHNDQENMVVTDANINNVNDDEVNEIVSYPTVGQYTEIIKDSAKTPDEYFDKLKHLRPVLNDSGEPIMSSGNFAVVFKMKDENGKQYAVRCFHRAQQGREKNYKLICEELAKVSSPYLSPIRYFDKELYIDGEEYPVLLMDWVEGMTLDKYIRWVINDKKTLIHLATNFRNLAIWLLAQPFAHGDLKPDNILVRGDGSLVLVDYDGMFVPAMQGQKAREIGSPDFRNPSRTEDDFNKDIDNFPIVSILLSLELLIENKDYLSQYGAEDRLLFSEEDYINIDESEVYQTASKSYRHDINDLVKLLKDELSGKIHCLDKIISIIGGEERENHANDQIELIAKILYGGYSIIYLIFPFIAFYQLEWRVLYIPIVMLGANVFAFFIFNIMDSWRPNKRKHILDESNLGCLGIPAPTIPLFFMASSSYEEEWYITTIIWVVSWATLMTYYGITSLNDWNFKNIVHNLTHKQKEKIDWIEDLQMALFLAPGFGLPLLFLMGFDSFFIWLKYVAIIDVAALTFMLISWIYRSIGKIN